MVLALLPPNESRLSGGQTSPPGAQLLPYFILDRPAPKPRLARRCRRWLDGTRSRVGRHCRVDGLCLHVASTPRCGHAGLRPPLIAWPRHNYRVDARPLPGAADRGNAAQRVAPASNQRIRVGAVNREADRAVCQREARGGTANVSGNRWHHVGRAVGEAPESAQRGEDARRNADRHCVESEHMRAA